MNSSDRSLGTPKADAMIGVMMTPGQIALERMPSGANSATA